MGVPVQIGSSLIFLLLVFMGVLSEPGAAIYSIIFVAIIIISIFLHELGHAWGSLIQGVPVRRIMLHGGGGFCERARSATAYEDELIVAMGPIVNLVIWAVSSMIAPHMAGDVGWFFWQVAQINLYLALFNLIPVMPLDGGRLFHLMLLRILPGPLAWRVAGFVGLALVILWVPLMLVGFFSFGMVLIFFPSLVLHWRMMRQAA